VLNASDPLPPPRATRWLRLRTDWAPRARSTGIFEPRVVLGQRVAEGEPPGVLHPVEELGRPAVTLRQTTAPRTISGPWASGEPLVLALDDAPDPAGPGRTARLGPSRQTDSPQVNRWGGSGPWC
jgi:hypothetical protein